MQNETPTDYINKTSKYIPIFYFGATAATLMFWLRDSAKETPEEMAKLIASLMDGV